MKILSSGLYKCHGSSVYVRVLKVYHQTTEKVVTKLRFEYKNGSSFETKNYKLKVDKIQHWEKVYDYCFSI